ncbi:MAG: ThiF family adenylyltransferase [Nanoarchaeota archaeon]|nr:ThiF family adenylyltransferase [Nanoarchaeota archaeon]
MEERYASHPWDNEMQKRIGDLNIAVIGDGLTVDYLVSAMVAFGFGKKGFYVFSDLNKGFLNKLGDPIEVLRKINKVGLWSTYPKEDLPTLKDEIDYIIAVNINDKMKKALKERKLEPNLFVDVSDIGIVSKNGVKNNETNEDASAACVASAVALEYVFREAIQNTPTPPITIYNPFAFDMVGLKNNSLTYEFEDKKTIEDVMLVGNGSMGNFVAINLALTGVKRIVLVDYDTIEERNLNRQILFYDSIGEFKVDALEDRLKKINNNIEIQKIPIRVSQDEEETLEKYVNKKTVLVGSVDSFKARVFLNYFAVKNNLTYIDGGCGVKKVPLFIEINNEVKEFHPWISIGDASIYVPNKSLCLKCAHLDIEDKALAEIPELRLNSCVAERMAEEGVRLPPKPPSVITGNMAIGGIITGEMQVLDEAIKRRIQVSFNSHNYGVIGESLANWITSVRNEGKICEHIDLKKLLVGA